MEVILQEDIPSLGKSGEVVKVSSGYGRNYLIPQGLAIRATIRNVRILEHQKRLVFDKLRKEAKNASEQQRDLEAISLTISKKSGEQDKLYGAVTAMDVAEALKKEGFPIDRRRIEIKEPIKSLGVYQIPVKLHRDVVAQVKVWVVKE